MIMYSLLIFDTSNYPLSLEVKHELSINQHIIYNKILHITKESEFETNIISSFRWKWKNSPLCVAPGSRTLEGSP